MQSLFTGKGRDNFVPVSEDVEGYRPLIRQYAAEFGIPEFEDLIAAVMMQKSGGQTSDPMQCSESGYNTEYPREPGGITDPEYSIKVGVQTLAEVLRTAPTSPPRRFMGTEHRPTDLWCKESMT